MVASVGQCDLVGPVTREEPVELVEHFALAGPGELKNACACVLEVEFEVEFEFEVASVVESLS